MRKETGINISDDIIVSYGFNENDQATQLKNVCENMREQIMKVLKVPFNSTKPDQPYNLHAQAEYDIGGENKDKKKEKDECEKDEVIVADVEVKAEKLNVNKNAGKKDAGKKNPVDTTTTTSNQDKKQNEKKEKKAERKKEEVIVEKEERLESAGKISIMIFKK